MTASPQTILNEDDRHVPVKIGLVGAGSFGMAHVHTINGIVEADLVTVVDSNREALAAVSVVAPGVSVWESLEEGIAASDADAWIVSTSTASQFNGASPVRFRLRGCRSESMGSFQHGDSVCS